VVLQKAEINGRGRCVRGNAGKKKGVGWSVGGR